MNIEHAADGVTVRAPAKLNLFLEVLGKRADGYHEIASLMLAVDLHDTLVFKEEPSGSILLQCDDPALSAGPDNLVFRAAQLLQERGGVKQGVKIELRKQIPLAAGLGGGSSDAAATLAALNQLWRLEWSEARLAQLGGELGSDVPFFFAAPAAWCTGRGEVAMPVKVGRPLGFVLVCPAVGLSTAEVYRNVSVPAQPVDGSALLRAVAEGEVAAIGRGLFNRLQEPAERLCPWVADLLARLAELGPVGQAMSGSGTSLYALCRDRTEAERIAQTWAHGPLPVGLGAPRVFIVRSCD